MNSDNKNLILNQCLFGYSNGHQLLASSLDKISNDVLALLLLLSDSVPGLQTGPFKSYWTGTPVPALKAYALLHTWPAPELPRPGCVWTHCILIDFADFHKLNDFSLLQGAFVRPSREIIDYSTYSHPTTIPISEPSPGKKNFTHEHALILLRALYGTPKQSAFITSFAHLDEAIFAIWSQQWPRLQRSFSFRTADVPMRTVQPSHQHFDLYAVLDQISENNLTPSPWEKIATEDLISGPTDFRAFLKHYGADMLKGRERFKFLAEIFNEIKEFPLADQRLYQMLDTVAEVLPILPDGAALKNSLFVQNDNQFPFSPNIDPLKIWTYLSRHKHHDQLPIYKISERNFVEIWKQSSNEVLSITEISLDSCKNLAAQLISSILTVITPEEFITDVRLYKKSSRMLLETNPMLLDTPGLINLDDDEILSLIEYVPDDYQNISKIINNIFYTKSSSLILKLKESIPDVIEKYAIEKITNSIIDGNLDFSNEWISIISDKSLLVKHFLPNATSFFDIEYLVMLLNMDVNIGIKAGIDTWGNSILRIRSMPRQTTSKKLFLYVYLMTIALSSNSKWCETLAEESFEVVHTALCKSANNDNSLKIIENYLPSLYFWEQWDKCRRLRIAIAKMYVNNKLSADSFMNLTKDEYTFRLLISALKDVKGGNRYIKQHLKYNDTTEWY